MKSTDMSSNGVKSEKRVTVTSTDGDPKNQASSADNSPVMMNCPELKPRGYRCDQLVEMAGDDSYSLAGEAPRRTKMKG